MEIIMIKKQGCMPCKQFEPTAQQLAEGKNLGFRSIMMETMPENMRPEIAPTFYLMKEGAILEEWAGTSDRKFERVLERHVNA
ncbi:MAG: hypothetical protein ACON34_11795 [Flavobacteriales bacterium]